MESNKEQRLSVIGLGKLGCTMLACFAHKGWSVVGMDINEDFVDKINRGISPIYEPGVDELIKKNKERITATCDPIEAVMKSNVSFIIVPTPSLEDGSFSTEYVNAVAAEMGSILRTKNEYHLVIVTSTVLLGDTANIVKLLERTSGKKCTKDFGVCYNPDFIALGNIVQNFLNPDMILIGESDEKAGSLLENIHRNLVDNNPNIHRMNFYNSELTKIALNAYCTLKITFANCIAEVCEKIVGGDIDVVTNALGDDIRIGRKYLKGGLSYGGPCFPRDNRAIAHSAAKFGVNLRQQKLTDELNDYHRYERIPTILLNILREKDTNKLSILGLTYKPDTTVVEESAAIRIINKLLKEDIRITVYDPAGMEEAQKEIDYPEKVEFADTALECIRDSKLCFIATPWDEFKKITNDDFLKATKEPTIFDAWGLYSFKQEDGIDYRQIGKKFK